MYIQRHPLSHSYSQVTETSDKVHFPLACLLALVVGCDQLGNCPSASIYPKPFVRVMPDRFQFNAGVAGFT